jgi:hypothetical protein
MSQLKPIATPFRDTGSLTAVGPGSNFSGYVQDHNAARSRLPGPIAWNRNVIITLEDEST